LGGEDMIAIDPADWPRLRLVVEVIYRLIEQDGIAPGPVWLTEQAIGWSWAPHLRRAWNARGGPYDARRAHPGHQAGPGVRR
jgi:hypothetical protein